MKAERCDVASGSGSRPWRWLSFSASAAGWRARLWRVAQPPEAARCAWPGDGRWGCVRAAVAQRVARVLEARALLLIDSQPPYAITAEEISASQMPKRSSMNSFGPGWNTIRKSTITKAAMPSPAVSALAATGSATVREVGGHQGKADRGERSGQDHQVGDRAGEALTLPGAEPARLTGDIAERGASQPAARVPVKEEHREEQHHAPTAAIISPRLNLLRSIITA